MIKVQVEFPIKSSISILYKCLSTPSGLSEWFCDDVDLEKNGKVFVFKWVDSEQRAEVVDQEEESHIRMVWLEEDRSEEHYFEFRIQVDEITGDVALLITDFCEPGEEDETRLLWESQVKDLMHNVGA